MIERLISMENLCPFQTYSDLFRDYILEITSKSAEYQDLNRNRLDALLIMADRVIFACLEHPDLNRVAIEIPHRLENVAQSMQQNHSVSKAIEDLLASLEKWLKAILWLVNRTKWIALHGQSDFTFSTVARELDLLQQTEIGLSADDFHQITEKCRQYILFAYRDRNFEVHETRDMEHHSKTRFLPASLFTLIAPLHKHYNVLQEKLAYLSTRPLQASELFPVMRTIASEQRNRLDGFGGREKWLQDIREKMTELQKRGGYLLLTANEGVGKSALCAKLIDELNEDIERLGAFTDEIRRISPWLPSVVVHFGKWAKQPHEVVRLLIDQINTLVTTPIFLPETSDYLLQPRFDPQVSLPISTYLPQDRPRKPRSGARLDSEIFYTQEDYPTSEGLLLGNALPQMMKFESVDYQRKLYEALDRAVQERRQVWVIIDALDEISPDGKNLTFLPEQLPVGVAILLTARPGVIDRWVRGNRHNIRLRLKNLERNEVPLLTGMPDDSPNYIAFNDQLYRKSDGWALMVDHVAQKIRRSGGDYTQVTIENSNIDVLKGQVQEWQTNDLLREILLLLAIFEPATPLQLSFIQYFLEHKYKISRLNKGHLRQVLQPVQTQLQGLDTDRVKLSLKTFAEYVRDIHCSERDLRRALSDIVIWLADDEDIDADTLAEFLQHWTDKQTIRQSKLRDIADGLVETFISQKSTERLYRIARSSWKEKNNPIFAAQCLQIAAESDNEKAMRFLGYCLLEGDGVKQDAEAGQAWLCQSAEKGYAPAMLELGLRLIKGDELDKNEQEGQIWLQKAAELKNDYAMFFLGIHHLEKQDTTKGVAWLRQAAELDNNIAMFMLSEELFDNKTVKDAQEAERWLRKLVELGEPMGMTRLGSRLLMGYGVDENIAEGRKWLRKGAEAGHPPAVYELGGRLLDGNKFDQNIKEGETWLRKAVEENFEPAIFELANRLIDGDNLLQNPQEGTKFFQQLINANNPQAMTNLANRLLDGHNLPGNVKKGQKLLRQAAKLNHANAMFVLGHRLIEGNNFPVDVIEGEEWLRQAVEANHTLAIGYLGVCLLDGDKITKDQEEGEKLLLQAAQDKEEQAMRILGNRLLDGDELRQDIVQGEKWLRQAAEVGEVRAMARLGEELLNGHILSKNQAEGEQWLRKAVENNFHEAMTSLGIRLLKGHTLTQDEAEGKNGFTKRQRRVRCRLWKYWGKCY